MNKIFSIGEALIDFIPAKRAEPQDANNMDFHGVVGGAPANCAAAVAKFGGESAFIGKLGNDLFGKIIKEALSIINVDVSKIVFTDVANTALAFVTLDEDGERDFSFYRKPSADMLLAPEEIDEGWFEDGDILHFCSVSLIEAPVKYAHKKTISNIKRSEGLVSYDINLRLPLWDDTDLCRRTITDFIRYADIIKISEDEMGFVFGTENPEKCKDICFDKGARVVFITKGKNGSTVYTHCRTISQPGYAVNTVDTTGAGDVFSGAILYKLQKAGSFERFIKEENLRQVLRFANKAGALATTKKGAFDAIPTLSEIENFK